MKIVGLLTQHLIHIVDEEEKRTIINFAQFINLIAGVVSSKSLKSSVFRLSIRSKQSS